MWLLPDLDGAKHVAGVMVRLGPEVRSAVIPLMLVVTGLVINLNRIRMNY